VRDGMWTVRVETSISIGRWWTFTAISRVNFREVAKQECMVRRLAASEK